MNGFLKQHKRETICFGLLIALTIVLSIPVTLFPIVRIFGWASYFYLAIGYFFAIFHAVKKGVRLRPANTLLLILSLLFIIATLHVVFCDKSSMDGMASYIKGSYASPTVGGVIFSIITSPVVVYCKSVWSIVIFMALAAVFTFLFFRPFIFNVGSPVKKIEPRREKGGSPVLSEDAPVTKKLREKNEPEPRAFNVSEPESSKDRAYRLLLGGEYDLGGLSDGGSSASEEMPSGYLSRSYTFTTTDEEKRKAARALLSEDGSESTEKFDRMERELGLDEKPSRGLFEGSEADLELFSGGARFSDPTFGAAVRQTETQPDAPAPLQYPAGAPYATAPVTPPVPSAMPEQPQPYVPPQPAYVPPQQPYVPPQPAQPAYVPPQPSFVPPQPSYPQQTYAQSSYPGYGVRTSAPIAEPEPPVQPVDPPVPERPKPDMTKPYMPTPSTREYVFPPKSLLKPHSNPNFVSYVDNWDELQDVIENKLTKYGIEAQLIDAHKGPTVTQVILELGESCSINKLNAVGKDLRRLLKSNSDITIVPQIPDTSYCGIEIPNKVRQTVSFQEVISSREYAEAKGDISVALGKAVSGEPFLVEDLAAMPHALIAGQTGSGKSVCINVILASILMRYRPDEVKLILIDLKQVEMGIYSGLPHMLFKEPLFELREIVNALKWIRQETDNRFNLFKSLHVRKLSEYNELPNVQRLPRIVIVIDEASELMTKNEVRKTVESTLSSLARVARAAGVHLLFATQNPVKEVITNEIQNNLNTKIAFAVGDYNHSMVIFKAKGAESLLGNGDMYIKRGQKMLRGQCAYISTEETEDIVNFILENNEVSFDEEMIGRILNGSFIEESESTDFASDRETRENTERRVMTDDKRTAGNPSGLSDAEVNLWKALKICYDTKNVSCSYLQRRMNKGYNAVANILEYWEGEGFVSKQGPDKRRTLLRPASEFYELYREKFGDEDLDGIDTGAGDLPDTDDDGSVEE